ncbi:sugar ABC transporter permease [Pseudonocardia sp. CA-107938]|uniref:sugar ABC transporter permease n=1 Tax=Pseudonocardia sp. CA-107938 TaxID=3240021 RepID=UPI003D8E0D4C
MTQTTDREVPLDLQDERLARATTTGARMRAGWQAVRDGEVSALPIVLGLVLIFVVFQILNPYFLSSANLVDLATQCAAVGTIALGIVLVLLVGQIDLSVGSMSGVASALLGVGLALHGWPLWIALATALLAGVAVGTLYGGLFVAFRVPSFVITLAGLLGLLGLQLLILGANGSINIPFDTAIVVFMQTSFVTRPLSYVLVAAVAGAYLLSALLRDRRRRAEGLSTGSLALTVARAGLLLVVLEAVTYYLNQDRGISAPFVLFVAMTAGMAFLLKRTAWGRSVFAVGGSVEAARRAGINVTGVYVSVFVLCSAFAALGGLLSAGRLATASISSGVGDTNLNAIAAAVIGGTSLFGGRGSAWSALLGIVVIQSIASGLTLLNLDSSVRYMITGGVLLLAVIVDAVSRRTRAAHGRA